MKTVSTEERGPSAAAGIRTLGIRTRWMEAPVRSSWDDLSGAFWATSKMDHFSAGRGYLSRASPQLREPPKRDVHWVFVGADGLRAGWGVLLFVLLFIGFRFLSGQVLRAFTSSRSPLQRASREAGVDYRNARNWYLLLLATTIMAFIERRPLLGVRISRHRPRAVRFISGLVWGFVALSGFVFVLWKARLLAFDGEQLHGVSIWKYALGWGLYCSWWSRSSRNRPCAAICNSR